MNCSLSKKGPFSLKPSLLSSLTEWRNITIIFYICSISNTYNVVSSVRISKLRLLQGGGREGGNILLIKKSSHWHYFFNSLLHRNLSNNSVMQRCFCSFKKGGKHLPCYWPKQLSVLSILHFLCFLPLRVKRKASIYSSSLSHIAVATKKSIKKYFCDTVLHANKGSGLLFPYLLLCLNLMAGRNTHQPWKRM